MSQYVFGKAVAMDFDSAVRRITEELAKLGFGVLTDIDVQALMEEARVGDATVPHPGRVQPALREPGDRGRYGNPYAKPIFCFIASSRTF